VRPSVEKRTDCLERVMPDSPRNPRPNLSGSPIFDSLPGPDRTDEAMSATARTRPASFLVAAALCGCSGIGPLKRSDIDLENQVRRLAVLEQENREKAFAVIFSSRAGGNETGLQVVQGTLYLNDRGAFAYQQSSSAPRQTFTAYFDPAKELVVVFPKENRAYRGPASILMDPECESALAGYDAVRILLGMGNVWGDAERNRVRTSSLGSTVSFSQPNRTYDWEAKFVRESVGVAMIFLTAKSGFKRVARFERESQAIRQYGESETRTLFEGKAVEGRVLAANLWDVALAGCPRKIQLNLTPYPTEGLNAERFEQALTPPDLSGFKRIDQLSPTILKYWLGYLGSGA